MCECVGSGVGVVKPYMADTAAVTMGDVAVPLIELKGVKYLTVTSSSTLPHGALPYHTSIHHFSSGITGWKIEATHTQKTARFCCKRTETNRKLTCRRARGRYTPLSCSLFLVGPHLPPLPPTLIHQGYQGRWGPEVEPYGKRKQVVKMWQHKFSDGRFI